MEIARGKLLALAVAAAAFVVAPPAADAAYSCANIVHDGAGADGASSATNTNVNGVAGSVYVPPFTRANLYGQYTSTANVAMLIDDSAGHFFQLGWYIGGADGLAETSTPRLFAGEGHYAGESLTALSMPVTGGTWHTFRLVQDEASTSPSFRKYIGYVDGIRVWTSTMTTTIEGTPRFLGETNFDCADMYGQASTSSGGPTLQAHHAGAQWSMWQERLVARFGEPLTTPSCWPVNRVNGHTATVLVVDQC